MLSDNSSPQWTKRKVKLLQVEDISNDAELALRELKRAGFKCEGKRVETEVEFRRELQNYQPDIILSDFAMPQFDGMRALAIAAEEYCHIPFIFLSGNLGEEYAVRALKNGAADYVLKTNLIRLPAAVDRAITDSFARIERRRIDALLRESEAGLARAQSLAKLSHIITGPGGTFEKWSQSLPGLLGVQPGQIPRSTQTWLDILHPEDRESFRQKSIEAATTGARVDVEYRLRHAKGDWISVRQVIEPLTAEITNPSGQWFCTLQDITETKLTEQKIRRLNRVYEVLSGINALIVRIRDRDELLREACRIAVEHGGFTVGWISLLDQVSGKLSAVARAGLRRITDEPDSPNWLTPAATIAVALREKRPAFDNDIDCRDEGNESEANTLSIRRAAIQMGAKSVIVLPLTVEGNILGVLSLYAPERDFFDDEEVRLLTQLAADVSFGLEYIAKEERVHYLAYYDPLTGLANRALFVERLGQQLHTHPDNPELVAVVLIDVERLRLVNDTMSRRAGDELLRLIARRLEKVTRWASPGRLVADCFGVIILGARDAGELAQLIGTGIKDCFGLPFAIDDQELRIVARAGVSIYPADGITAESLLQNAETALRSAKRRTERFVFYAPEMTARVAETLTMETKLRKAVELEQFVLHYQPKFDASTKKTTGVEALIRWNDPETGLVPPLKFVQILEETGLIFEVGRWALRQALSDQQRWRSKGLKVPRVAVNVSAQQLRDQNFVLDVRRALATQEGMEPALELEITESLLMENIERNIARLETLRALGVTIAMDDFGTGYSSLNYLARLPMDTLKIDRSFVLSMTRSPVNKTIVSTIISLAHSLGLKVVAEGVETNEQLSILKSLKCDEIQGFLMGRPTPAEKIAP